MKLSELTEAMRPISRSRRKPYKVNHAKSYTENQALKIYSNAKKLTLPISTKGITGYGDYGPLQEQLDIIKTIIPKRPGTVLNSLKELENAALACGSEIEWKQCAWVLTPIIHKDSMGKEKPSKGMHTLVTGMTNNDDIVEYFYYSPLQSQGHQRKFRINKKKWLPMSGVTQTFFVKPKDLPDVAKTKEDVETWIKLLKINRASISDNLVVNCSETVWIKKSLDQLPFQFGTINGNFRASEIGLKTLKGFPKRIGGTFYIDGNNFPTSELKYILFSDVGNYNEFRSLGKDAHKKAIGDWFNLSPAERQDQIEEMLQKLRNAK